ARIDHAFHVAGLSRHAERVLDLVVVRLELVETQRPVFHGGTPGNSLRALAPLRLAHDAEVPGREAPAPPPLVQRRAADAVHHRVDRRARIVGRLRVRSVHRDLAVRLLGGLGPAAEVVAELVGREVLWPETRAGLERDHLTARGRERLDGDAAG